MAIRLSDTEPGTIQTGKKTGPFRAWLSYFLGLVIIAGCVLATVAAIASADGDWQTLKTPFMDYKDTRFFKERTRFYYTFLTSLVSVDLADPASPGTPTAPGDNDKLKSVLLLLGDEGENLKYYASLDGDQVLADNTGSDVSSIIGPDNMPVLPEGYSYCWYFDGLKTWVIDDGSPLDTERLDSGYRGLLPNHATGDSYSSSNSNSDSDAESDSNTATDTRILLAVKDVLVENPYGHSRYYEEKQVLYWAGRLAVAVLVIGAGLLAHGISKRDERRVFDLKLAAWSGRMWFEVKAGLSLLALWCFWTMIVTLSRTGGTPAYIAISGIAFIALAWWAYVMLVCLKVNGRRFFTHNSLSSLLHVYRRYERQQPWQKMMLRRAYALVCVEALLVLLGLLGLQSARYHGSALLSTVLIAGIGLYLIYAYLRRHGETVNDLGLLVEHIHKIREGDTETKLEVAETADVHQAVQDLNGIQEGMSRAVSEKVKSERMKVDLITNVSHDLKTPLTSIMSYVELLAKEEGLPEHVNDYIGILAQKTERLKNLIQDLFELSKATSNDMALEVEKIDMARLVRQVLADMQDPIEGSGLVFRVNVPDEPLFITSDGGKLYRVLQNLISNALKYSIQGSRVFIDLALDSGEAVVTIKNTANYEMDFNEEEIMQRFTRGDRSRSTEGSGLGLSIAKSFTEACGGRFTVSIDGDLFKVVLKFDASR